jgi:ABC-type Fe3+/spermidine/putrescine transport system ATPase subunit
MTRVTLNGLTRHWPGAPAPALDRLSLDLAPGTLTALLGPSGCGKTTVLRMIAGLLAPTSGDILLDGRSILRDPPERRGAVMVFQNHLLFAHMTVAENVGFGLRMRGLPRAAIAARVAGMLDRVKLSDLGARRPADLSGGQQARAALARALILRPRVLLLDEPLASLDAHLRAEMRDLIRTVQKDLALTTLIVTHDQEEAVDLGNRIALLLDGRLRQLDAPDAFYRRPADAAVAAFFGARNLVAGASAGGRFDSPLGPLILPPGARTGPGLLTFRPESVRIAAEPAPAGAVNALQARLRELRFLGTQTRLVLAVGPVRIEALLPPDMVRGLSPGDSVTLALPPESLWVMPPAG